MEITAIMALVDAALTIVEKAEPMVQEWFKAGLISPEEQQARADRIEKLRLSGFTFVRKNPS